MNTAKTLLAAALLLPCLAFAAGEKLRTPKLPAGFAAAWLERYTAEFPALAPRASVLVTRPGAPAHRL